MLRNLTSLPSCLWLGSILWLSALSPSIAQRSAPPSDPSATSLSLAKSQLDHSDLEAGEKTLWTILAGEPTNQGALTMLGVIRARQQRYPEAEALFNRVLQLDPESIVASRSLAHILLQENRPDDAIREYQQAIKLASQDSDLKIELAQLQFEQGNFFEALATLDTIKSQHFPVAAVPLKAASLLSVGRRADALNLLPLVRGSSAAGLELARVFVQANDADAALKTLALIQPHSTADAARAYYLKGRALREMGDSAAAMASFRRALAADRKFIDTLVAMAEIFAAEKKHDESLRMLEEAQALSPASVEIMRHVVVESMQAGRSDKALLAAQSLQIKSSDLNDKYLVASVMLQENQYLPAAHILEDYVSERPQDAKAFLGLGIAYLKLLRYPDARQALEHSLQLKPDLAESEFQLGLVLAQQGDRQQAVARWEKVIQLQPAHAQALFNLGTAYLETGELQKAEADFEKSLKADPNNMKTEYDLALVLNKMGKPDEAKPHLERYRKMQDEEHAGSKGSAAEPNRP